MPSLIWKENRRLLEVLVGVSPTGCTPQGWHISLSSSGPSGDPSMSSLGTCRFFLVTVVRSCSSDGSFLEPSVGVSPTGSTLPACWWLHRPRRQAHPLAAACDALGALAITRLYPSDNSSPRLRCTLASLPLAIARPWSSDNSSLSSFRWSLPHWFDSLISAGVPSTIARLGPLTVVFRAPRWSLTHWFDSPYGRGVPSFSSGSGPLAVPLRYFCVVHLSPLPLIGCLVMVLFPISSSRPSPWSDLVVPLVSLVVPSSGIIPISLGTCRRPLVSVRYNSWECPPSGRSPFRSVAFSCLHVKAGLLGTSSWVLAWYFSDLISLLGINLCSLAGFATVSMFSFTSVFRSMSICHVHHLCILLAPSI